MKPKWNALLSYFNKLGTPNWAKELMDKLKNNIVRIDVFLQFIIQYQRKSNELSGVLVCTQTGL